MLLLDPVTGEPVDADNLDADQGGADGWARSLRLGVIDSMTPARLASIYQAADRGEIADLVSYAMAVERFDGHLGAVLHSRRLGAQRRRWTVVAPSDRPEDVAIRDEVQRVVDGGAWRGLLTILQGAVLHPFATAEIGWRLSESRWWPAEFHWRDPRWHVVTDEDEVLLRTADAPMGEPLRPWRWIVHRSGRYPGPLTCDGLARTLCTLRLVKSLGLRAWVQLAEVFGVPLRVGTFPRNSSDQEKTALRRALQRMGLDGVALLPAGTTLSLEAPPAVGGASDFHQALLDWIDDQASRAVLGATMTTRDGSSRSQAEVHERVSDDRGDDDCLAIAGTLQRDLVRPFVDLNFGPRDGTDYPVLVPAVEDQEDLERWIVSVRTMVDVGLRVAQSQIRDRLGLDEPEEGAEILAAPEPPAPPQAPGAPGDAAGDPPTPRDNGKPPELNRQADDDEDDVVDQVRPGAGAAEIVDAVAGAARGAVSYDDFRRKLGALRITPQAFVDELAARTLAARGVGDASD